MSIVWRTISSEVIFEHPRLTLIEDVVELPDGQQTTYLKHGPHRDYPTLIPRDEQGKFLLLREHAYPVNEVLLQFPEGDADGEETVQEAAVRELREEAGLKASKFTVLGHTLREHRRSTTKNFVVLAEGLSEVPHGSGDIEEQGIEKVWLTEDEVWQSIADGHIVQKNTLSAWVLYQAFQRSEGS